MSKARTAAADVAVVGLMAALLSVGKIALNSFANIEVITLLLAVYALTMGWKRAVMAAIVFSIVEILQWGINIWVVMYLVLWPAWVGLITLIKHPLAAVNRFFIRVAGKMSPRLGPAYEKSRIQPLYALVSGAWGYAFGFLCAVIQALFYAGSQSRMAYMLLYWGAGLPFDTAHAIGNLVINLVLFGPLLWLFDKCAGRFKHN